MWARDGVVCTSRGQVRQKVIWMPLGRLWVVPFFVPFFPTLFWNTFLYHFSPLIFFVNLEYFFQIANIFLRDTVLGTMNQFNEFDFDLVFDFVCVFDFELVFDFDFVFDFVFDFNFEFVFDFVFVFVIDLVFDFNFVFDFK